MANVHEAAHFARECVVDVELRIAAVTFLRQMTGLDVVPKAQIVSELVLRENIAVQLVGQRR